VRGDIAGASLVISHAGAGSIFETLRASRPLIVAANRALADDHQGELARALEAENHCLFARELSEGLPALVRGREKWGALAPLPPRDPAPFLAFVEGVVGGDGGEGGAGSSAGRGSRGARESGEEPARKRRR
jgi:beta-1,4-N-acetylglucosaminyltransferase